MLSPVKSIMKAFKPILIIAALGAVTFAAARAAEDDEHDHEAKPAVGSIHVTGKLTKVERAGLAKLSFDEALKAAHAALPGKVVNGALEAEDGNLQYAFEVLNDQGKIDEVAIDAGNGKVLGIDKDDKD